MKPLTVYKASAGSGKTFTLTIEYIKLLMVNPLSFKKILAVTFTNKATEEMKMRILSQLYGIWKELPDSESYIVEITEKLGIGRRQASRQAGVALNYLLHNYNYFRVETIDTFFQSILRNLARELDLTANLRIDLNDGEVEEQAVDRMIESLDSQSTVLKWIISYIMSTIDENKSWNVIGQIKSFGTTIFKDYYKSASKRLDEKLSEEGFFENYTKQLKEIRNNAKNLMSGYAEEFERVVIGAGLLPESFTGGSRSSIKVYFARLKEGDLSYSVEGNKTLVKCWDDSASWASKSSPERFTIIRIVESDLMDLLHKAEEARKRLSPLCLSADYTLKHLSKLRLLNSIEKKVRELNREENRFLLSDTPHLLHTLIKDDDTPFIFEKTGSNLDHIMIDEFQDTSRIQWMNFKVLLKECMSRDYGNDDNTVKNLIVGDVKQSIYRWRAGDWRLLNGIAMEFNNPNEEIEIRNLDTNYRSERNIVNFNNAFFTLAVEKEYENEREAIGETAGDGYTSEEIKSAYSDVLQKVPDGKESKGFVRISMFTKDDYVTQVLEEIGRTIDLLAERGIPENKIAMLLRGNRQIEIVAEYFTKTRSDVKLISDEAFKLGSSLAVNILIYALRLLAHPDDILTKATLVVIYQRRLLGKEVRDNELLTAAPDKDESRLDALLPERFIQSTKELVRKPLLDIVEAIYTFFELEKMEGQSAYICKFYDCVSDFTKENIGSIELFLTAWEESISNQNVQSEDVNGIRLLTIHKSKGLEFENVIIPFCDWILDNHRNDMLWCEPQVEPFAQLPLAPIDYSKKLIDTIYADDYKNEHIQNTVDNMNLLYVAFTRASKNLFVIGKAGKAGKVNRSELLSACIPDLQEKLKGSILKSSPGGDMTFDYGTLCVEAKEKEKTTENVFMLPIEQKEVKIRTHDSKIEFRQSNKSADFINKVDEESERATYIKMGSILHKLFSQIHTLEDIDGVLKQLEYDGVLYDEDITSEKIENTIYSSFFDERVSGWFDSHWKVFNECNIMFYDESVGKVVERRPDRVIMDDNEIIVIDFKFGKPHGEYHAQVRQYMQLLGSMSQKNISGYLWYVYSRKIERVEM
ncbi:MAG: UvrD-helicase domain-containing protein [Prevotella sp.]|nr:UvrD-helicase domain-containing protein [Prevotella sp.]